MPWDGWTLLNLLATSPTNRETLESLGEVVKIDTVPRIGEPPTLSIALANQNKVVIQWLLERRAKVDHYAIPYLFVRPDP
jgi:hypothetical protein